MIKAVQFHILLLVLAVFGIAAVDLHGAEGQTFVNPVYGGQDPFVFQHEGHYYMAATAPGERSLYVFKSGSLTDRGIRRTVYTAPHDDRYGQELWAPEIHHIDGHWYIYTCGDNGDNKHHRLIVLAADTDDPLGSYHRAAVLTTPNWAIDETVFRDAAGKLYCVWSGWPDGVTPDSTQHLFVSAMKSPTELIGPVVDISGKMHAWETIGRPAGLNEGPQPFWHDGRLFLLYACSGSWTPDYCLGLMECTDGDVMNPDSWVKQPEPAFRRTTDVYGPGHGCVTRSPDGTEDWLVYHSSIDPEGSWNRSISIAPFTWKADGTPDFARPPSWGEKLAAPSGEPRDEPGIAMNEAFENLDRWKPICFFRDDTIAVDGGTLAIRGTRDPRYHDKAMLRGYRYDDFQAIVHIAPRAGDGFAGVLFRASNVAVGQRYQGYLAEISPTGELRLSKGDGHTYKVLGEARPTTSDQPPGRLRITARGDKLEVYRGDERLPAISVRDSDYASGRLGLQAVGVNAEFKNFVVQPQLLE